MAVSVHLSVALYTYLVFIVYPYSGNFVKKLESQSDCDRQPLNEILFLDNTCKICSQ